MFYYIKVSFASFRILIRIRTVWSDSDPSKCSDPFRFGSPTLGMRKFNYCHQKTKFLNNPSYASSRVGRPFRSQGKRKRFYLTRREIIGFPLVSLRCEAKRTIAEKNNRKRMLNIKHEMWSEANWKEKSRHIGYRTFCKARRPNKFMVFWPERPGSI